jgi:hypothetical protein
LGVWCPEQSESRVTRAVEERCHRVCGCVWMCVCVWVGVFVRACVRACVGAGAWVHVRVCVCGYTCVCVCACVGKGLWACGCLFDVHVCVVFLHTHVGWAWPVSLRSWTVDPCVEDVCVRV